MSEPKKALIVVENNFVPLDPRVWSEATTLRDAGWKVTIMCPEPSGVYICPPRGTDGMVDMEGVRVLYFRLKSANNGIAAYLAEYLSAFFTIWRLSWLVWRRDRFDILHICNPPDIFFPLLLFYRLLGVGIVYDHHDLFPEFVQHRFHGLGGRLFHWAALVMEYMTCRSAHIMIAVNESYREVAIQRAGLSNERIVTVRNGPRTNEFSPLPPVEALKSGFPFLVCYIGIMGYEDGIPEMLESIRHVIQHLGRRDIYFHLMGGGALLPWAQEQIAAWGLGPYVTAPGMVKDRTVIRQYLSTADVCLSPEPMSPLNAISTFIKVGEYMAMGKPVVAFDLKETRWTACEAAIYVEPGDTSGFGQAISDLIDSPARRTAMGGCGRERFLQCLAWEHQECNLLAAYDRAMHSN